MNQGTGSNNKSKAIIINESGLYSLILSSKLSQAKEFKLWVPSVVLSLENGYDIDH
ncbi:MAG: BRO family protein [Prevotellaceae bacterium]|nr:BRO family protein [Prevotellaceae bacterium]